MKIAPAGIGGGEDDRVDADRIGVLKCAGGGFEGGDGGFHVVYQGDALVRD